MRKFVPLFALIALAAPFAMAADEKLPFITEAYMGNLTEVDLGQYAGNNAGNGDVKNFGWKMATDHTRANEELREVAKKNAVVLPDALDKEHQQMVDKLMKLKGAEFDKPYMRMMLQDHRQDIKLYESAVKNGKTPEIRAYATKQLPILRNHLATAEQVAAGVGVKSGGGGEGKASDKKR
jgi:putative membrane protein